MKKKALPFALSLLLISLLAVGSYGQNRDFKSSSGVRGLGTSEIVSTTNFYSPGQSNTVNFQYNFDFVTQDELVKKIDFEFSNSSIDITDAPAQIDDNGMVNPRGFLTLQTNIAGDSDDTLEYTGVEPIGQTPQYNITFDVPASVSGNLLLNWEITGTGSSTKSGSITLAELSSVSDPENFAATTVSTSAIDLSWNLSNSNPVMLAYNTTDNFGTPSGSAYSTGDNIDGANSGTILYIGSNENYQHSGLTAGENYYYKIFSYNDAKGRTYSNGVTDNQVTAADLPFTENFENSGDIPYGWLLETISGSGWTVSAAAGFGSDYGMRISGSPKDAWLFSQPIYLETGTYVLDFRRRSNTNAQYLDVKIGSAPSSVNMTTDVITNLEINSNSYIVERTSITVSGNGIYYLGFHALNTSGSGSIDIDDVEISEGTAGLWTGYTSSVWNVPTNWDNGAVPDASVNVVIPDVSQAGLSQNFPIVTSDGGKDAAACNNLTINANAVLTINSGETLSITGNLNINSTFVGNAYVGSLVDKTNVGVTIGGSSSVDLEILGSEVGTNSNWHLISSPVASFNSTTVFNHCYLRYFDETDGEYHNVDENHVESTVMKGYATMYSYESGAPTTKTLNFTGSLNTRNKSITCTKTDGQSGWNLVGNPYPSAVDWDLVTADDYPAGLDNTLYVVDGDNVNSYKPGAVPVGPASNIIPAMQGFFVKCLTNNTDLTFKNNYRVSNQATFLKNDFDMHNVLAFVAENETGLKDYMNVYFRENAGPGYDYDWDITKFFHWSELSPQVYVIEDGAYYTNNAYDSQNKPESVEIGFYSGTDGLYKIGLKGTSEIDDDIALHLYDRKENIHVDLREIDQYEFNYSVNDDHARFKLMLNTTGIEVQDYFPFNVWLSGNQLMVNTGDMKVEQIRLYDVSGKLLKDVSNAQNQTAIQLPAAKSVYIIQMVTLEGVYSKKIVY